MYLIKPNCDFSQVVIVTTPSKHSVTCVTTLVWYTCSWLLSWSHIQHSESQHLHLQLSGSVAQLLHEVTATQIEVK